MIGEWIKTEDELPPEDGQYEITNNPIYETDQDWTQRVPTATAYYDGYGFSYCGVYRQPSYWRKYTFMEKKYGKVKDSND